MSKFYSLLLFTVLCAFSSFGQENIEEEIKTIRKHYQYNVSHKQDYKIEKEHYNWEEDELIPSLSEEEMEQEYNEQGNFIADKKTYRNEKGEIQIIEIDDETTWYQEGKNRTRHREYHFWKGEFFFYFEHTYTSYLNESFESSSIENRIYIKDDQIIRWLGKEAEGKPDMSIIPNYNIEPKTSYLHDYHLLDAYSLQPDW
jgi:hypothetical protein